MAGPIRCFGPGCGLNLNVNPIDPIVNPVINPVINTVPQIRVGGG